jgi:hypothetical protein
MDIFIDCEWFFNGKIYLLCSGNLRKIDVLYGRKLSAKNIRQLLKKTLPNGHIYFYGPDIGYIEKCFNMEIRKKYRCVNLLPVFKHYTNHRCYKLAYLEKRYNIKRLDQRYKNDIRFLVKDWFKPEKRQQCIDYCVADVKNLVLLKKLIFAKHNIRKQDVLRFRLK